jgi:hypothetical protein
MVAVLPVFLADLVGEHVFACEIMVTARNWDFAQE